MGIDYLDGNDSSPKETTGQSFLIKDIQANILPYFSDEIPPFYSLEYMIGGLSKLENGLPSENKVVYINAGEDGLVFKITLGTGEELAVKVMLRAGLDKGLSAALVRILQNDSEPFPKTNISDESLTPDFLIQMLSGKFGFTDEYTVEEAAGLKIANTVNSNYVVGLRGILTYQHIPCGYITEFIDGELLPPMDIPEEHPIHIYIEQLRSKGLYVDVSGKNAIRDKEGNYKLFDVGLKDRKLLSMSQTV